MTARARTYAEMEFAASLQPCPGCGSREAGPREVRGDGTGWVLSGTCPSCGKPRGPSFLTFGDPGELRHDSYELSPEASQLTTPRQFFDELARVLLAIDPDLARLAPPASTCLHFLPATQPIHRRLFW